MPWEVVLHDEFVAEVEAMSEKVQDELYAHARVLAKIGPTLGRPRVDRLEGSKFPNLKELRFNADDCVIRVVFAFDPKRRAVLLVAGDKRGENERRFYKRLIAVAEQRYEEHLKR